VRRPLALLVASLLSTGAQALVGGTVDPNAADSPWSGVVSITPSSGGTFSGVLIDPWHVLTAAHVVYGKRNSPGDVVVNLNVGGNLTSRINAGLISIPSTYNPAAASGGPANWPDDIAVVRLSQPVPTGVRTYGLFGGTPGLNGASRVFTMVAYGGYADGTSPSVTTGSNPAVKRVGQNRVDALLAGAATPGVARVFVFDLDGPTGATNVFGLATDAANLTLGAGTEAGYAGGDSGSPIFVLDGGEWKVAGVGAFNGDPAAIPGGSLQFGAIGGGILVAPYADWIQQQTLLPVPEPETYALMLAGLACVVYAARRRARS